MEFWIIFYSKKAYLTIKKFVHKWKSLVLSCCTLKFIYHVTRTAVIFFALLHGNCSNLFIVLYQHLLRLF